MSLVISKVFTYDTDAGNYIQAVEAADGQALEAGTRQAINNFVIGCKQDGIWNAIKASCILSGARTLNGALQPLVGTAPTNVGPFVTGDYNRKTGLVGNGSSKYLNTNRAPLADPQDSSHFSVFASSSPNTLNQRYISSVDQTITIFSEIYDLSGITFRINSTNTSSSSPVSFPCLLGAARPSSGTQQLRSSGRTNNFSVSSNGRSAGNYLLFARHIHNVTIDNYSNARLAFYSIGESLDLALLDARVTALITAFGVAIP